MHLFESVGQLFRFKRKRGMTVADIVHTQTHHADCGTHGCMVPSAASFVLRQMGLIGGQVADIAHSRTHTHTHTHALCLLQDNVFITLVICVQYQASPEDSLIVRPCLLFFCINCVCDLLLGVCTHDSCCVCACTCVCACKPACVRACARHQPHWCTYRVRLN